MRLSAISDSISPRPFQTLLCTFFLAVASTFSLYAQRGTLQGTITDAESADVLPGATVQVLRDGEQSNPLGAISRLDGTYQIKGLVAGTYLVTVTYLGYAALEGERIVIESGKPTRLDVKLEPESLSMDDVVITASRKPEKATRAPASTSVVKAQEIEEQTAVSPVDYVRGVKGLDVVQSGLAQNTVVTRGFNNVFSGTLTSLTDNRIAGVPSLRYNASYFIPLVNEDIEQIEIVRGPGSALYGPNALNGVMHIITRSPFSSSGTWLSVAGGERDLFQGMFRHAGTVGDRLGYKISGQYMRGTDWGYVDTAEQNALADFLAANPNANPDTVKIAARDSAMQRFGGEARLDWLVTKDATLIFSTGFTQAVNNTDVTGVGAAQAQDWAYWYHQARFRWKDLFVQTFLNRSDAGETYVLRTGEPIVDRSTVLVAQAQHATQLGERERLTYGTDFIWTNPVTDSTVTGSNEEDDSFTEIGVYVQSETAIIEEELDFVAALRLDKHSRLDDFILSPRAAVVWTPEKLGAFRLTWNSAYSAPTTNEMFLDILAQRTPLFDVRANGVPQDGYSFRFDEQGNPQMRSHFSPDPTTYYPTSSGELFWDGVKEVVKSLAPDAFKALIDQIPAPAAGVVGTEFRWLNSNTGAFDVLEGKKVVDRSPVKPTINNTVEFGWQGVLFDRIGISADFYRSRYTDFVGPLEVVTPSVFYEQQSLQGYLNAVLLASGMDTAQAQLAAGLVASQVSGTPGNKDNNGIPIGTVTAINATDPTAVMFTYRNYGDITLYGYDLGIQVALLDGLTANGNLSYVDQNFFPNLDDIADLSLNAPKFKYNLGVDYRNTSWKLNTGLLFRHVDGFPVRSGVYSGNVPGYSTLSLNVGYALPWVKGLGVSVSAQNLMSWVEDGDDSAFETRHTEFVGTPAIGRMVLGRLTYEFQ